MNSSPVVVITGASSGIGEKTALVLGEQGYRVVLAARRVDRLEKIVEQIRQSGGDALAVGLDISEKEQITDLVDRAIDHYGRIDILVNNAGSARHLWLDEQSLEDDIQTIAGESDWHDPTHPACAAGYAGGGGGTDHPYFFGSCLGGCANLFDL